MKQIVRTACLATLALTLVSGMAIAKDAKLTFAPEGKTLHYKIDVQQEMSVGFQYETNHKGEVDMVWMEKTEEGNSKISIKFNNVEGTAKMGDNLQDAPLGINGMEVHVYVSPQGELVDTDPQGGVTPQDEMLLDNVIETLIPYFSTEKVGEGDSWVQDRSETPEAEGDATVDGEFEYFLDELKKKDGVEMAKIIREGTLKVTRPTPGGIVVGEAKGEREFEVVVDGGYLTKTKSTIEFDGKMGKQNIGVVFRIECALTE